MNKIERFILLTHLYANEIDERRFTQQRKFFKRGNEIALRKRTNLVLRLRNEYGEIFELVLYI